MTTNTPKGQHLKKKHAGPLKSHGLTFEEMVKKAAETPPPQKKSPARS